MDLTKLTPWGMAANAAGGLIGLVGAFGKKDEAQKQLDAQRQFTMLQRNKFESGYGDLINQAKGAKLYQGDLSRYTNVEQQADLAKRMASGMSRGAGEQIARDQAAQTSANALAAATRGAGSGTDIMTAALMAQQGENQAQNAISSRSAQEQMAMQNMAQQQQFAALGQTAAAAARERGLEFQSLANRQQNVLALSQQKLEGVMQLEQDLFDQEQAKAAALQEAKSAIWSGIGGIASGIGSGMMQMGNQATQFKNLKSLYNTGIDNSIKSRPEVSALFGNPLTGGTLPSISGGGFKLGTPTMTAQQSFDSQYSWNPINKEWFSTSN